MYQILVVDDERIERNGIKMLLRHMQLPCEIAEAANGRDALEYLKGAYGRYFAYRCKDAIYGRHSADRGM